MVLKKQKHIKLYSQTFAQKYATITCSDMENHNTRPRCDLLFEESIKSAYTRKNYDAHLRQFRRYAGLPSNQDILAMTQNGLQMLLEDYLLHLRQTANPNSVPSQFQGIRHFCVMNRICLDWNIIHKMFPPRQKRPTLRAYTSHEIRSMLDCAKNPRDRALVLFLASTGARIGVFDHKLTLRHVRRMHDSYIAVRLYAGEVEEYWSFLTPQASRALDTYHGCRQASGEMFYEDTPIFATTGQKPKQLRWNGARSAIYRLVSKSVARHRQEGRYDVQVAHGFRKRFNTVLKLDNSVNHNIAEKLMGHKNGLDGTYLVPTLDELFSEFAKVIRKIEV